MNAIIHDMEVRVERGDTMINPKFKNAAGRIAAYDIVVANPMWNQDFSPDILKDDPFDDSGPPGASRRAGDWAWLSTPGCLNGADGRR